jgi:FtsP/CotA-like multicopper oxidase with cupredoxin domain
MPRTGIGRDKAYRRMHRVPVNDADISLGRRDFLRILSGAGSLAAIAGWRPELLGGSDALLARSGPGIDGFHPLRLAPEAAPQGLTLKAAIGEADIGGGLRAPAWMLNESLPSPLLRVRRGEPFRVTLQNELPDELILHWHGVTPPEHSDGHPRLAVRRGMAYEYDFTLENRAGTYWYHSHTHHRTAKHTALGIGGMLIVEDEEEAALGLPSGEREIPLILQDRQLDAAGRPVHHYANLMAGYLGSEVFANGVRRPYLDCRSTLYRFRILNGSNARIFRLERSDRRPVVLIGNDGGLLERPVRLDSIDIAPAERVDLLIDLSDKRLGDEVTLRSRAFQILGGIEDLAPGSGAQGAPMDLLRLRIATRERAGERIPQELCRPVLPDPATAVRERTFRLETWMDQHTRTMVQHGIDGHTFAIDRVDIRVPFGETEIWSFVNDHKFAHPIHVHGTHFSVLSRTGGRGSVMPWEQGLKDTVLLHPSETVSVAVRFDAHRGLFPLHCHNLEHEDAGMMLNLLVE